MRFSSASLSMPQIGSLQRQSRKFATRREGALMADRMSFHDFDPRTITRTGS